MTNILKLAENVRVYAPDDAPVLLATSGDLHGLATLVVALAAVLAVATLALLLENLALRRRVEGLEDALDDVRLALEVELGIELGKAG